MVAFSAFSLLVFASNVVAAAVDTATSIATNNCKEVRITVTGTAQNRNITGIPTSTLDGLVAFYESAPVVTVTGPQTLEGTYCTPTTSNANNNKLQVFFGSIVENKGGFQAQGGVGTDFPAYRPEQYSWVDYANKLGYATLNIDRLGNGRSSHPDPVLVVQAPYEIALYNNLAEQLRAGTTGQLPRSYPTLIYVGNSYGSQLGAGMANAHPDAYNDFVLTGFSYNFQQDFLGVSLVMPAPASIADPARFGTLNPFYLIPTSQTGLINSFFGSKAQVDFEDAVTALFFPRRDVVSVGQFVSVYGLTYEAPEYTGRVLVLTGEQDQAVCGPGSPIIGPANCGPTLEQTGTLLFPTADYNWKSVDRTGHAIALHSSSQKVFDIAHRYLAGQTYRGGPLA